jgi:signal transduction histidine kinase
VAREAIRNARTHASPSSVQVAVSRPADGAVRLVVRDDGSGFSPQARERRGAEGHLGLTLLEAIVAQAGGTLEVRSSPGRGTVVEMELPAR